MNTVGAIHESPATPGSMEQGITPRRAGPTCPATPAAITTPPVGFKYPSILPVGAGLCSALPRHQRPPRLDKYNKATTPLRRGGRLCPPPRGIHRPRRLIGTRFLPLRRAGPTCPATPAPSTATPACMARGNNTRPGLLPTLRHPVPRPVGPWQPGRCLAVPSLCSQTRWAMATGPLPGCALALSAAGGASGTAPWGEGVGAADG